MHVSQRHFFNLRNINLSNKKKKNKTKENNTNGLKIYLVFVVWLPRLMSYAFISFQTSIHTAYGSLLPAALFSDYYLKIFLFFKMRSFRIFELKRKWYKLMKIR